jgi:hypothetical protein
MKRRPSAAELRRGEAATWGPRPSAPAVYDPPRPRLKLLAWRPVKSGALRGFASIEFAFGLRLHDLAIFVGDRGPWASLPEKPVLDRERRQKIGPDGKPIFTPVGDWRSRELSNRFSDAVLALIRAERPGALDEGGG